MTAKFTRKDLDKLVEDALKPEGKPEDIAQRGKSTLQKLLKKGKPEIK